MYQFEAKKSEKDGDWYWALMETVSGNSIAIGGEGYKNKRDCLRQIEQIKENAAMAEIIIKED